MSVLLGASTAPQITLVSRVCPFNLVAVRAGHINTGRLGLHRGSTCRRDLSFLQTKPTKGGFWMTQMRVSQTRVIRSPEDALHYCLLECKNQKLGCAHTCKIRMKFHIPPHGDHYPKWTSGSSSLALCCASRCCSRLFTLGMNGEKHIERGN